jgi:methylamine dehydrogenase heavy chain
LALLGLALQASASAAPLPNETSGVEQLPARASPHWVWVNDFNFSSMADGRAFLVDGDSGRMLGLLSTGYSFNSVVLPRKSSVIYSPETYYSRGTRGTRTDVVTLYDPVHLTPLGEISIPAKRSSNMPSAANAALSDDERFLIIYNFTPAQSATIVDVTARKFVGEVETGGCALVYPIGNRAFFSLCPDGTVLVTTLNEDGHLAGHARSAALFDGAKDPLAERPVRLGNQWLFASFQGTVYPLQASAQGVTLGPTWPLTSEAERSQGWRNGGLQYLAVHLASGRLFAIMHQGSLDTHKEPGTDVWVYDVAGKKRVQQIKLRRKATSIVVSQDAKPLLFTCFEDSNQLDIYDALSGTFLRTVESLGQTPAIMVTP